MQSSKVCDYPHTNITTSLLQLNRIATAVRVLQPQIVMLLGILVGSMKVYGTSSFSFRLAMWSVTLFRALRNLSPIR